MITLVTFILNFKDICLRDSLRIRSLLFKGFIKIITMEIPTIFLNLKLHWLVNVMQEPASLFHGRRLCSEATVTSITKYDHE